MTVRLNVNSLSAQQRSDYVGAVKAMKASGKYDDYPRIHQESAGNAHSGPAFLPWHREFLARYEKDLQDALGDASFRLPYWDWAEDGAMSDPKAAPIWRDDFMGGDGAPVASGPFTSGQWTIWPRGSLERRLGQGTSKLPTPAEVDQVLGVGTYDSAPWGRRATPSFRDQLEGWSGPNLHNRIHVWVGGSMLPMTSPNDPVFFLHHCNVDRLWAMWQLQHGNAYAPTSGGPAGHNLNDPMPPWDQGGDTVTPADQLPPPAYDTTVDFAMARVKSPAIGSTLPANSTQTFTADVQWSLRSRDSAKLEFSVYVFGSAPRSTGRIGVMSVDVNRGSGVIPMSVSVNVRDSEQVKVTSVVRVDDTTLLSPWNLWSDPYPIG